MEISVNEHVGGDGLFEIAASPLFVPVKPVRRPSRLTLRRMNTRFRRKLQIVAVMLTALVLAGCGRSTQPETTNTHSQPHMLTLSVTANGSGTVTSSPTGINCGLTCTASFAAGTTVALTATPGRGSIFVGWSGACSGTGPCTVPLNAAA